MGLYYFCIKIGVDFDGQKNTCYSPSRACPENAYNVNLFGGTRRIDFARLRPWSVEWLLFSFPSNPPTHRFGLSKLLQPYYFSRGAMSHIRSK